MMTHVERITPVFKLNLRLTTMLKFGLCDYSDAYILVKGKLTVVGAGEIPAAIQVDGNNKQAIFENCTTFTDCITEMNNTHVDNAKDLDVVMPIYNLIEYQKYATFYTSFAEMSL